jgi:hypothetical protein
VAVACLPTAVSLLLLVALFMQISGVSLALTWPHRLCLLRVLLCAMPLLQAFPFASTLGEVTLHQLSQACMFIYSSHGKWVFPPLLWNLPLTTTLTSFPTPDCWAHDSTPASGMFVYSSRGKWVFPFSCGVWLSPPFSLAFPLLVAWCAPLLLPFLARPTCLFTVLGVIPLPPSLVLRVPHPLCYMSLLFFLLINQFLFFPRVGVCLSRGLC